MGCGDPWGIQGSRIQRNSSEGRERVPAGAAKKAAGWKTEGRLPWGQVGFSLPSGLYSQCVCLFGLSVINSLCVSICTDPHMHLGSL